MFSIDCPCHGTQVLLGLDSIEALLSTSAGIEVYWRCTCGERGVWVPVSAAGASAGGPVRARATTTTNG